MLLDCGLLCKGPDFTRYKLNVLSFFKCGFKKQSNGLVLKFSGLTAQGTKLLHSRVVCQMAAGQTDSDRGGCRLFLQTQEVTHPGRVLSIIQ